MKELPLQKLLPWWMLAKKNLKVWITIKVPKCLQNIRVHVPYSYFSSPSYASWNFFLQHHSGISFSSSRRSGFRLGQRVRTVPTAAEASPAPSSRQTLQFRSHANSRSVVFSACLQATRNALAVQAFLCACLRRQRKARLFWKRADFTGQLAKYRSGKDVSGIYKGLLGMVFRVHPTWGRGTD